MADVAPTAGTTLATSQATPTWYDQLSKSFADTLAGGVANVGTLGQNWYNQPLVQGFDPLQSGALQAASTAGGQWQQPYTQGWQTMQGAQPYYSQSATATGGVTSGLGAAQGRFDTAQGLYGMGQQQAGQIGEGLQAGMYGLTGAQGTTGQMGSLAGMMGQGLPDMSSYYQRAASQFGTMPGATNAITSQLPQAARDWSQAGQMMGQAAMGGDAAATYNPYTMQQFMNPYTGQVANQIASLANRNLTEKVLPGVNSTFTGAGQFGGTRSADFTNRALRDNQEAISNAQATMLANAQNQAAAQYSDWANKGQAAAGLRGQMGTALGNLGTTQASTAGSLYGQQAGLQGQLGQLYQGLGTSAAQIPASIYGQQAGLAGTQAAQQAAIAQAMANLPASIRSQMAAQYGTLGGQQAALGSQMGQLPAALYGQQAGLYGALGGQQSALGSQMGQYGQLGQQQAWDDIAKQYGFGQQAQALGQKELDAGYQDWQSQLSTPINMLGALSKIVPDITKLYSGNQVQTAASNAAPAGGLDYLLAMLMGGLGTGTTAPKLA